MTTIYPVLDTDWYVRTSDGVEAPARITINDREYLVVDPASVVTLDPNDAGDLGALTRAMVDAVGHSLTFAVAEQVLRSLLPTPPLPEPNGLGAVVEWDGDVFVRAEKNPALAPWLRVVEKRDGSLGWRFWSDMPGAVVKGHGVGCTCGGPGCPGAAALTGEES